MNRRGFLQAAAALATAHQTKGHSGLKSVVPVSATPADPAEMEGRNFAAATGASARPIVEIDLADSASPAFIQRQETDLFVRLEELNPGDPGQLSGAQLRIMSNFADGTMVQAWMGDVLPESRAPRTTHWLGLLDPERTHQFAAVELEESDGYATFFEDPESAEAFGSVYAVLCLGTGPELHLMVARHTLGVLRGELLTRFFAALRTRCQESESA